MKPRTVIAIDSPYFSAAVALEKGRVVRYAPIIKYMKNWSETEVKDYCQRKRWKVWTLDSA